MNRTHRTLTFLGRYRKSRGTRGDRERRGAALVEFALVAPLMILFTLGLIEMGRMTMVKQLLVNITREGARLATLPDSTSSSVQAEVATLLANARVNGATITLTPTSISTAPSGSMVTVSIQVPAASVSWLNTPLFMAGKTVSASTSMRRETF